MQSIVLPLAVRSLQANNTIARVSRLARSAAANVAATADKSTTTEQRKKINFWSSIRHAYGQHLKMLKDEENKDRVTKASSSGSFDSIRQLSMQQFAHTTNDNNNGNQFQTIANDRSTATTSNKLHFAHPVWILVSPLVHIPVLISGLLANRKIAAEPAMQFASDNATLHDGGILWFKDLTLPVRRSECIASAQCDTMC